VIVSEDDLPSVMTLLRALSTSQIASMHRQVGFFWRSYFSSMRAITLTTLQIINDRVFPYAALKYEDWNNPTSSVCCLFYSVSLFNDLYLIIPILSVRPVSEYRTAGMPTDWIDTVPSDG